MQAHTVLDQESEHSLQNLRAEKERAQGSRVPGVKTVLVVLSSAGMAFDREALSHFIRTSYPDAKIYFWTTLGKALGEKAPKYVDLLIDFTGPGQRQKFLLARKLRSMARVVIGRDAGLFRKKIYTRVFDERAAGKLSLDVRVRERRAQREVLVLAGVAFLPLGELGKDLSKSIALGLPSMQQM